MDSARLDAQGKPLPKCVCPVCGYHFDSATAPDNSGAQPKPGDVSVCLKCGEVFEFDPQMRCVLATVATLQALQQDPEMWATLGRMQAIIRANRFKG